MWIVIVLIIWLLVTILVSERGMKGPRGERIRDIKRDYDEELRLIERVISDKEEQMHAKEQAKQKFLWRVDRVLR